MTERMRFVLAVQDGSESFAACCRRFGISRKSGYKWWGRYDESDPGSLANRSRAPRRRPHAMSDDQQRTALELRTDHPFWGPKKIVAHWARVHPDVPVPAASTVGDLLHTAGLVVPRRRRRRVPAHTQPLAHATTSNAVWCADFKGDFTIGDGTRCYPLTVTDACDRYLLRCQALPSTAGHLAWAVFEALFRECGLPEWLRTDNGVPFVSTGVGGLTPLSIWWIRLGIRPERIAPGCPQQNGRHERMHRTLKAETCSPPAASWRLQQQRFDTFQAEYNEVRPHEALGQLPPADRYTPSPRPFPDRLPELVHPDGAEVRRVRTNGTIKWRGREAYVGEVLVGESVALRGVDDGTWEVTFGPVLLGHLTPESAHLVRP